MTLNEVIDQIINSNVKDWFCTACWGHGSGPSYKDKFLFWNAYEGDTNIVTVQSHSNLCVYKPNISISVAYGLDFYDTNDENHGISEDWATNNPDSNPGKPCYADIFVNNGLVFRVSYCVVDGGRSKLPFPHLDSKSTWVVEQQYSDFMRILNELAGSKEYDTYLRSSGITVINSPWI